jgi:two-component system cell cycle sensor histidine kinase/response regulator CckA
MKTFTDYSIRAKLTIIVMITTGVALLLAVALLGWFDVVQARQQILHGAQTSARIIANNSTAALSFGDEAAAAEILAALQADANVGAVGIYNQAGDLFAAYQRADWAEPFSPRPGSLHERFTGTMVEVAAPVRLNGRELGTVLLQMDATELHERQARGLTLAGAVLLAAAGAGYLLAMRLQKLLTQPIQKLAEISRAVATAENYSLRATKTANDELGQLVDGFNNMLAQIETRDKALQEAQAKLEQRVAERTQALFAANQQLQQEVSNHKRARAESDRLQQQLQQANAELLGQAAERQRVQDKLRSSEEQFAKAFSLSPVALAVVARNGRLFADVNERFAELTGRTREQLVGSLLFSIPIWSQPEVRVRIEQLLADGQPVRNWECQIIGPDKKPRHALLSAEAYQVGNVPCVLLMTQDVSERVSLESQLRQSQKMEAIGQLAAGVAHDFNNLLTVIQGYTQLLEAMQPPDGVAQEALDKILGASQRAAGLTSQLLTFSRKQVTVPKAVELNKVIDNVVGMLRPLLGENICLTLRPAQQLPAIRADASMLEQVIVNLAVNARDAMPRGGELVVSTFATEVDESYRTCQPQARAGHFVCLQVSDSGCGMDAVTLERIFEPFFTTKGVGKGTGLGLATVYGIVKQHNGWIEVASQINVGTTFKVFFPAVLADGRPTEFVTRPDVVRGGTETIMVVEDEQSLRELVTRVLRQYGYQVLEAAHGPEAIRIWQASPCKPELLLTDMMMPEGMSGWELAEQIRATTPNVKVLFTSGYSPELFNRDVELDQQVNFLPKPYHPRTLAGTVRTCLDKDSRDQALLRRG